MLYQSLMYLLNSHIFSQKYRFIIGLTFKKLKFFLRMGLASILLSLKEINIPYGVFNESLCKEPFGSPIKNVLVKP
ncbi:hypothetical protein [Marinomonas algarum]|uniref:Uncharacterized protein n=1 Tax=Marinomonas algarum TaxID=2883105 RepID=A0A9X1LFD2_9GAMM|nr:hypothetical protein [Marinomonas algarum]MCB5162835.1 hypothetical protein [Marinomonas algarum]